MKKLILIAITILVVSSNNVVFAAELTLSITIPNNKVAETKEAYLAQSPKPEDFEGSDKAWIEHTIKEVIKRRAMSGAKILRDAANPYDRNW